MLNSSVAGDLNKASVRRSVFLQTCTLLSQYVNGKKALGDLSFGMPCNIDGQDSENTFRGTTMNLFPLNERAEEVPNSGNDNSMGLFAQHVGFTALKPASSEIPQYAPMTLFYAGQVMVFNDFPAHKAKEIMELANQNPSTNNAAAVSINDNNDAMKKVVESATLAPPGLNVFPTNFSNNRHQMQEAAQQPGPPIINDLPIARKASLHRFLEKRKDRIIAKAPYDKSKLGNMSSDMKANNDSNSPWLGLGAAAALPSVQP